MRRSDRPGGSRRAGWVPEVPGVLSADQLLATARSIAATQSRDGSIGWPDGRVDAWNHVECAMALSACGLAGPARRAYGWLAAAQQADGCWLVRPADGTDGDGSAESNHAAYPAVGIWHEYLVTGDEAFAISMWPTVRRGVEFVLGLQLPGGQVGWRRRADGTTDVQSLLAACSSIYHALRCGAALAVRLGEPQPEWELAADQLGHAVASHAESFADKGRFSMDWYYPVLGGAVRGAAAAERIADGWDRFVVPGLGVRCVSDQPWVTGAETCELVIALDAIGDPARARDLLGQVQHLRAPGGGYWTGWQFANRAHFPREKSAWTSAAMILAADALSGTTGGSGLFASAAASHPLPRPAALAACGCQPGESQHRQPGPAAWSADPVTRPLQHP